MRSSYLLSSTCYISDDILNLNVSFISILQINRINKKHDLIEEINIQINKF